MFQKPAMRLKRVNISRLKRFCIVIWIILILTSLGIFVGGIFSSNQNNQFGQNTCLLYANNLRFSNPQFGIPQFPDQFGGGFLISNPKACNNAVFEGIAAIMVAILLSIASAYYVFKGQTPQPNASWGLAFVGTFMTIFTVAITVIAYAGLVDTCALLGDECEPIFNFTYFSSNNVGMVRTAIAFGWVASILFLLFTCLAFYWVGNTLRPIPSYSVEKGQYPGPGQYPMDGGNESD